MNHTIYLGAQLTAQYFYELLSRFLRNIVANIERTERPTKKLRNLYLHKRNTMQMEAQQHLTPGEELVDDPEDDDWFAASMRPAYELDANVRRERERLLLARDLLECVIANAKASGEWQRALAEQTMREDIKNAMERARSHLRVLDPSRADEPTPPFEPPVPAYAYAVHISELNAVLDALGRLFVDPHKEG